MPMHTWLKLTSSLLRVRTFRTATREEREVRNDEREAARTKRMGRCSKMKESVVISVKNKFAT